eukprot:m.22911 g.22911  ORF g.22911 m.22911 type:complete len:55 (+) comp12833_c0_seq1:142-306(+)
MWSAGRILWPMHQFPWWFLLLLRAFSVCVSPFSSVLVRGGCAMTNTCLPVCDGL